SPFLAMPDSSELSFFRLTFWIPGLLAGSFGEPSGDPFRPRAVVQTSQFDLLSPTLRCLDHPLQTIHLPKKVSLAQVHGHRVCTEDQREIVRLVHVDLLDRKPRDHRMSLN